MNIAASSPNGKLYIHSCHGTNSMTGYLSLTLLVANRKYLPSRTGIDFSRPESHDFFNISAKLTS